MARKKFSKKIENRARLLAVQDIEGWFLVSKDEDISDEWFIAWLDAFRTKKRALEFAANHRWSKPYEAMRGRITVRQ